MKILQPGDEIDYRTKRLNSSGLWEDGIRTAIILGTTAGGGLIRRRNLTVCVQTHNIVAARRGVEPLYVAIEEP